MRISMATLQLLTDHGDRDAEATLEHVVECYRHWADLAILRANPPAAYFSHALSAHVRPYFWVRYAWD